MKISVVQFQKVLLNKISSEEHKVKNIVGFIKN